jgi:adenylate cyclase
MSFREFFRKNLSYHQELRSEFNKSEIKRIRIFLWGLAIGLAGAILNYIFFYNEIRTQLDNQWSYLAIMIWAALFMVYEFIFLKVITRYQQSEKGFPYRMKLLYVFDEAFIPTILLFVILYLEKKPVLIDSPILLIYFILLIVSALHLDFFLSLMTGIAISFGYMLVLIWVFNFQDNNPDYNLKLPETVYYARTFYFLFSGICSGLVANEIRRRMINAFTYRDEKEKIENLFGQQVSQEVVFALLNQKASSQRREVTVMFFDIRDFTNTVETKVPEEVIEIQNQILGPMIDIVNEYKGVVNQILGDGFMATFGAPVEDALHADHAFQAGLQMLRKIQELKSSQLIPPLQPGIGLHSGDVITGNIGNASRKQYSISGTTVIIASRIEQLNKKYQTEFLISRTVADLLQHSEFEPESLGYENLKGLEASMEIIKVS